MRCDLVSSLVTEHVLEDQVAVVTGAHRGIGQGIALRLAEAGARIVIGDIADAHTVVEQIRAQGGQAVSTVMDVSSPSDADGLADITMSTYGRLDILVNNAAIVPITGPSEAWDMPNHEWQHMLDVNLSGAFYCSRAALRPMLQAGSGCIINISSRSAGRSAKGDPPAYSASKAGLLGLTMALSADVASSGVRVNTVMPALVASGEEAASQASAQEYPLGTGTPRDVAEAVLYLASPAARWVSGTHLYINGGLQRGITWL